MNKLSSNWFALGACVACLLCSASVTHGGTGFVEVRCDTAADVYLDATKVGSTSPEQASLIIEAKVGRHILEIRKRGFKTQTFSIDVEPAKIKQLKVAPFSKTVKVGESGEADERSMGQKVGSFKLQTVPVECTIDVPKLQLANQAKTKADWFVQDIPVGVYTVTLTGDVPGSTADPLQKNRRTQRVQVPVAAARETYLLVNLITGEVKDIPAEQLLAEAQEWADRAEKYSDFDAWRNVIKLTEQALAVCHIEPQGARELRDRARAMVQEAEDRSRGRAERITALEKAILVAQAAQEPYRSTKRGHGEKTYTLEFTYKDFADPILPRDVQARISVTIDLGDALGMPANALVRHDNRNADLVVSARGTRGSIWHPNRAHVSVYNKAAERVEKQLEEELRTLKGSGR